MKPPAQAGFRPIEDYALIGDCRACALVSGEGSIDWLCLPRFDSPAIFASLIHSDGGRFAIRPDEPFRSSRHYRPDSNVLTTRFETDSGAFEVTDLFFASSQRRSALLPVSMLIRKVRGLTGKVPATVTFEPRKNFGLERFELRRPRNSASPRRSLVFQSMDGAFHLAADFDLELTADGAEARLAVEEGQSHVLILSFNENAPAVFPPVDEIDGLIEATDSYWRTWSSRISYRGRYRDAVVRSALTLKLLVYAPSGAIIAAPTNSLPEKLGAPYNWDYRYCWLRDASFTVNALLGLGLDVEAHAFLQWLLHATRLTHPRLQVVYGVLGKPLLKERTLEGLDGYRGSRPVRLGNGAHDQKQLDVYGEVLDAAALSLTAGQALSRDEKWFLQGLASYVLRHWQEPDAGIWETRQGENHYVYSKVMCWVALHRAARLARQGYLDLDAEKLEEAAAQIRQLVLDEGFSTSLGSFAAILNGEDLDASVLRLPLVGFLPAGEPRMAATVDKLWRELGTGDLLYRHLNSETLGEGAFVLCSFWLVECLADQGRLDESRSLLDSLCARANDVGLFSEEIDVETGSFLGNFPQAFTHIGLINAVLKLEQASQKHEVAVGLE